MGAALLSALTGSWGLLKAAWTWAKSPVGRWVLGAIAVILLLLAVHAHGVGQGVSREKAAQAKRDSAALKAVMKREARAEAITARVADNLTRETVRIETVTQTLIKEVPVHVPPAADARCVVPVGFVRLHDAAAASEVPVTAGGSLEADSGVALSAVAETVALNYGDAHAWRAEVIAWRTWYAEQAKAWGEPVRADGDGGAKYGKIP